MKKIIAVISVIIMLSTVCVTVNITFAEADEVILPVIMYHSVLKSKNGVYIVSPTQLEQDFKRIVSDGYTAVTARQVIDFVDGKSDLPKKPILITFDDGHYNNLYYAKPLLEKYNLTAVLNVIGKFSDFTTSSGDKDNPNYSHVTWDEVAEISNSGVIEIGNHTYNMHNFKPRYGVAQKSDESDAEYVTALKADVEKLQKIIFENTGSVCKIFAYPFGKYGKLTEQTLVDMGFRMIFTCNEGVNVIKRGEPKCLYKLKRINRDGRYDTQTLIDKIDRYANTRR
ncbi:MAG: polysaccharide deacetylase family protein [Corallococcus sp.]|nr:polysaccharide deacetylase family protein [Bacillota bacterium]MCM1533532.1 polysaccharide deacetylase family protein [Corallococcus sp.]